MMGRTGGSDGKHGLSVHPGYRLHPEGLPTSGCELPLPGPSLSVLPDIYADRVDSPFTQAIACTRKGFQHPVVNFLFTQAVEWSR